MKADGITGDQVTYATLIKGCLQFKKLDQACNLFEEAKSQRISVASDLKQSIVSQVQRSKDVTLLSRLQNLEKVSKPKYFEANVPTKSFVDQEDDFKISNIEEEEKDSKIPTFFNSKKQESKLKKTAPEFKPKAATVTEDDFIISEDVPVPIVDKFENSGPSENSNTIN